MLHGSSLGARPTGFSALQAGKFLRVGFPPMTARVGVDV